MSYKVISAIDMSADVLEKILNELDPELMLINIVQSNSLMVFEKVEQQSNTEDKPEAEHESGMEFLTCTQDTYCAYQEGNDTFPDDTFCTRAYSENEPVCSRALIKRMEV